jgi:hypothetical protein
MLAVVIAESQLRATRGSVCVARPWTQIMLRVFAATIAILLLGSQLHAQTVTATDQETISSLVQQVKDLQRQTLELQQQVKILQGEKVAVTPLTAQASLKSEPTQPVAEDPQPSPHESDSLREFQGIQWRGFGEADYKVLNQRKPELGTGGFVPGSAGDFFTGDFDLFLTSRLTDRSSVLGDIVFEEGDAQTYKIDLRRVLLKFDVNDHLKMSFGRYQTSIGYYNWAFRSAAWLQTTNDRPLIMEYATDGGLLPTQAVGVSVTGSIPSGWLGLNYIAEYGSSDTIRPDIDGSGLLNDENNGNHVVMGFFSRPDRYPGLQIGASFFHDKISNLHDGLNQRLGQSIVNGYVVYVAHGLELLNEGFLIRHSLLSGPSVFNMPAFYTQASRAFGRFRPFARYQYVNANPGSIFEEVLLRRGPSFGLRYDLNDSIAFTAQLDHTLRKGQPDLNGLQLQFAFTF